MKKRIKKGRGKRESTWKIERKREKKGRLRGKRKRKMSGWVWKTPGLMKKGLENFIFLF